MSVVDAVIDRLRDSFAAANDGLPVGSPDRITVYDGGIDGTPTGRYLVVWTFPSRLDALSVDGEFRDMSGTFQVTSVAFQPDSGPPAMRRVRWLADAVNVALSGWIPTVAGLNCHPVEPVEYISQQSDPTDDKVGDRRVSFLAARFRWSAELPI